MAYLEPSEYGTYGLSAETSDFWIATASAMVDAHCRRSSLLATPVTERLRVQRVTGCLQLTYAPVVSLTAVQVRYAPSCLRNGGLAEYAFSFGLPGQWVSVDVTSVSCDAVSGEVQLPANLYGLPYSEAEVSYVAGFAEIPTAVKVACAQIVKNAQATPGLNVKSSRVDTMQTAYFSDSLLDSQVRMLLRPFVAERVG